MLLGLQAAFDAALGRLLGAPPPSRIGLAVSGGGDSVALMHLAARRGGPALHVATVDHGLRSGSADEAEGVAQEAASLGLPHETLRWDGAPATGIQEAARDARIALLTDWAERRDLGAVLTGHTMDDQAETVLMRLARGGGPRAIAGIPERGGLFARPLLGLRRADLRDWLRDEGIGWTEDPSNEDGRFERVRWRRALPQLEALGLTVPALARTAARMALAAAPTPDVAMELDGTVRLGPVPGGAEIGAAIALVGTARPRQTEIERAAASDARRLTLGGCILTRGAGETIVAPEPARLAGITAVLDERGQGAWRGFAIDAPDLPGATVAALGEAGARIVPRRIRVPHLVYLALPAIWRGDALAAFHPGLHDPGRGASAGGHGPRYRVSIRP